ncbi:MAG: DoxX family membrane protein [Pseudomonadota bacterium]
MRASLFSNLPQLQAGRATAATLGLMTATLAASAATAHVRWFVDADDATLESFPSYSFTDPAVLAWIVIGLVLISIAVFLDGRLPSPPIVSSKIRHDAMELLRVFTGISFLLTAYGGALIAPHLVAYGGFGVALLFLQAIIGIILISNHLVHHAALLMVVLFFGTMLQFGFVGAFEYVNVIGIALFLFFNHAPSEELRAKLKPYSVDVLRIFTGIALITLGITEKLAGAMLGQGFIAIFDWNFMPMLGFEWYTDQLFVLSAGAMEVIFGIILVLGVITRLNILVVAIFMLTSNIVFLLTGENENALLELVGHMPIIATAIILLLLGYGQRIKLKNPTLRHDPRGGQSVAAE